VTRIVSLLPAATEIVAALGLVDDLVGVSHECDHPAGVAAKPRVTQCEIHGNALPSAAIDRWVGEHLGASGTLYTMDEALLRRLAPDVILTQRLCDVCAVGWGTVSAFAATLPGPPRVVDLEPTTLAGVLGDIATVGAALGVPERAARVVAALETRIAAVAARAADAPRRRCILLEWIDPPFRTGHWGGAGRDRRYGVLGRSGEDAARVPWQAWSTPRRTCSCSPAAASTWRAPSDVELLRAAPGWATLPAVARGEAWAVDGGRTSAARPRIVDSLELLATLLHRALSADHPARRDARRLARSHTGAGMVLAIVEDQRRGVHELGHREGEVVADEGRGSQAVGQAHGQRLGADRRREGQVLGKLQERCWLEPRGRRAERGRIFQQAELTETDFPTGTKRSAHADGGRDLRFIGLGVRGGGGARSRRHRARSGERPHAGHARA
jgi:iron complex transport system substrate-binding protein